MVFEDTHNPELLFLASRNAEDIYLTGILSSKVTLTVYVNNSVVASFTAEPYGGSLQIRLRDILESLDLSPFPRLPQGDDDVSAQIKVVKIAASGESDTAPTPWEREVFRGGYEGGNGTTLKLIYGHWWTWRGRVNKTLMRGKEYVGCITDRMRTVNYTVNYTDGTSETYTKEIGSSGLLHREFTLLDVSYETMRLYDTSRIIKSYTVVWDDSPGEELIFEVVNIPNAMTFLFRNSLGFYDTVYASGRKTDGVERDVKTFLSSDRKERTVRNDSREQIQVNSGYANTAAEKWLWEDFFLSEETYVVDYTENASPVIREIIIDEFDLKGVRRQASNFAFKFHYAEKPKGRGL